MTVRERAVQMLRERGPMTAYQLSKALGCVPSQLYAALRLAVDQEELSYVLVDGFTGHNFRGRKSKLYGTPEQMAEEKAGALSS